MRMAVPRTVVGLFLLAAVPALATVPAAGNAPAKHHRVHHHKHRRAQADPRMKVEVINGTTTQTQFFDAPQKPGAKQSAKGKKDSGETRVAVLNGTHSETEVFAADKPAATHTRKGAKRAPAEDPSQIKVAVVNGTKTETRVFEAKDAEGQGDPAARTQPVVVGITSEGSSSSGANGQPVVVGVEAGGASKDAGDVTHPLAAPAHPKRPPYRKSTPQTPQAR